MRILFKIIVFLFVFCVSSLSIFGLTPVVQKLDDPKATGVMDTEQNKLKPSYTNSLGMEMVPIPAGYFYMGLHGKGINFDESPIHKVTICRSFFMSATEVTNAQYEQFDPAHKMLRGKFGLSKEDDEAVIFVNYHEAMPHMGRH